MVAAMVVLAEGDTSWGKEKMELEDGVYPIGTSAGMETR